MAAYDLVLFALLLYLSIYLFVLGIVGLATRTPLVHRYPFAPYRPTVYFLLVGLLLFDTINYYLGSVMTFLIFCLLMMDIIYETIRPFLRSFVEFTSASRKTIEEDLLDAFKKLGLGYRGTFPRFNLVHEGAKVHVKYWPELSKGEISISPASKRHVLAKIAEAVEKDFEAHEGQFAIRGYLVNIIAALAISSIVLWRYLQISGG